MFAVLIGDHGAVQAQTIWSGTLIAGDTTTSMTLIGWDSDPDGFVGDFLTYHVGYIQTVTFETGSTGSLSKITNDNAGGGTLTLDFSSGTWLDTAANRNSLRFRVVDEIFEFGDGAWDSTTKTMTWSSSGLSWADGDNFFIRIEKTATATDPCETGNLWCATLTVGATSTLVAEIQAQGYCDDAAGTDWCGYGSVDDDDFLFLPDDTTYTVESIRWGTGGEKLHLTMDQEFPAASLASLTLKVGSEEFALEDLGSSPQGSTDSDSFNYRWEDAPSAAIRRFNVDDEIRVQILGESPDDATLSDLTVVTTSGGHAVSLTPAFDPDTTSYEASVAYTVPTVTVAPTTNASSATATIVPADTAGSTDYHQVDLSTGSNAVTLTVVDGSTTGTYTVTVTREAVPPAPTCESDEIWCATLTVGSTTTAATLFGWGTGNRYDEAGLQSDSGDEVVTFVAGSTGDFFKIANDNARGGTVGLEFKDSTATWLDTPANRNSLIFRVGSDTFNFADASWDQANKGLTWINSGLTWAVYDDIDMSIVRRPPPMLTVSIEAASGRVAEGSSVAVTVRLSGPPERRVSIPLAAIISANAPTFSFPEDVEFEAMDTEEVVTLDVLSNSVSDIGETIVVSIREFGLPTGIMRATGSGARVTVTVVDDDFNYTASYADQVFLVDEDAGSVTVTVRLRTPRGILGADLDLLGETTVLSLSSADDTAAAGSDYTAVSGELLSFAPSDYTDRTGAGECGCAEAEKTVTVTILEDSVWEGSTAEEFGLVLDGTGSRVAYEPLSGGDQAVVQITDNDAEPTVSFTASPTEVGEDVGTVTLTATISGTEYAEDQELTLEFTGTATQGMSPDDYTVSGTMLTLARETAGASATVTVTVVNDTVDEDDEETIIATLKRGTTEVGTVTVTITDDDGDDVIVSFDSPVYTATEGGTAAVVMVNLSQSATMQTVIPITKMNQDSTVDGDYSGVPTSLTFESGDMSKSFTVTAVNDSDNDDGESVLLGFGTLPTGVVEGSPPNATVALVDDDFPMLTMSMAAPERVVEGGSVDVTVSLSGPPERRVSIRFDTVTFNVPAFAFPEFVVFEATETVKVAKLQLNFEPGSNIGEDITIFPRDLPTGIMASTGAGAVTLAVVDSTFNYTASYADADQVFLVDEDAGSVTVTVRLRPPPGILEADLDLLDETTVLSLSSADDTATAGSDYTAVSGVSLSFAPSDYTDLTGAGECGCAEAEKTVTVAILEDSVWEGSTAEEFGLVLDGTGSRVAYDPPSGGDQAVVQITDNDAEPTVSFTARATEVGEDVGTVTLTATISGTEYAEDQELTLEFTGTATQGMSPDDYTVSGTMLTLARETAGASATVTVTVVNDTVDEVDEETIIATLKRGTTEVGTVTVTITDDDGDDVIVSFDSSMYTATEGGTAAVVMVNLSQSATMQTVIPITKMNQDSTVDGDYSGVPGSLTFASGDMSKSFTVTAVNDSDDDDGESVLLGFGTLPTGVVAGTPNTTVNLADDDSATACSTTDPTQAWCATLTTGWNSGVHKYIGFATDLGSSDEDFGSLSASTFTHEAVDYTVTQLFVATLDSTLIFATTPELHSDGAGLVLHIEKTSGELDLPLAHADLSEHVGQIDGLEWEFGDAFISDVDKLLDDTTVVGTMIEVRLSTGFNRPARGSVVIDGAAQVGNTLTADLSGISDANGLTTPRYSGQWIRVNDDGSETDISGATGSTYMVTAADVGKRLEVKVDFTDDEDNSETKTSAQTAKVAAAARACTPGNVWCATLTVGSGGGGPKGYCLDAPVRRCDNPYGALSDDGFTLGSVDYLVKSLRWGGDVNGSSNLHLTLDRDFPGAGLASLTLKVDVHEFVLSDATRGNNIGEIPAEGGVANNYRWGNIPQAIRDFGPGVDVTVDLLGSIPTDDATLSALSLVDESSNPITLSPPAFAPGTTIYAALVANSVETVTVTATKSATSAAVTITPTDGDSVASGHQITLDVGSNAITVTVVDGSTTGTYTVTVARAAASNTPATGKPGIGGIPRNPQHGLTLTADPSGISDSNGLATPDYRYQWVRVDGSNEGDISGAADSTYTVTAADVGKTLKVRVEFTDDANNAEMLTSDATAAVAAQSVISFDNAMFTVIEGAGSRPVTLRLTPPAEGNGSIDLLRTYQGMATDADISGLPPSVSFQPGSSTVSHAVSAVDDEEDDDGESVRITLGTLPPWMTLGSRVEVTVTLRDNDDPAVEVEFGALAYTATEDGTDAEVTVTLSAAPERTVVVPITKTNQGSTMAGDYSGVPTSLTFGLGDLSKSFTVSATDDLDNDDSESVLLGFGSLPPGVTAGSLDEAVLNLTDNDGNEVMVSFGSLGYTATEGGTAAVVMVNLSRSAVVQTVIPITKANLGSTVAGDYSGVPTSLTFESGDLSKSFTVLAVNDSDNDDGERVLLGFGTLPTGVGAGNLPNATVDLVDDDDPAVRVKFTPESYTVAEGEDVAVTVLLNGDPEREVVIPVTAMNQGGASASDYSGAPTTLTFSSGETSKSFTVSATDDVVDDDGESVLLGFGSLPAGVTEALRATATVTITDDDERVVWVSPTALTVPEGEARTYEVALGSEPTGTVTVRVSGHAGTEVTVSPAAVIFTAADWEVAKTLTVSVDDDMEVEADVTLMLTHTVSGADYGANGVAAESVEVEVPGYELGASGNEVLLLVDGGGVTVAAGTPVPAGLRLDLPAAHDGMTVTIRRVLAPGESPEGFRLGDVVVDITGVELGADEEATVCLPSTEVGDLSVWYWSDATMAWVRLEAHPSTDLVCGVTDHFTIFAVMVAITDDDGPEVRVKFTPESYTVAEGEDVAVTVLLNVDPEREVVVPVTATGQGGASASDYSGVPTTLTFSSGETSKSFTVTATDDAVDDDGESVLLGFGSLPAGVTKALRATATVTIIDDDGPAVADDGRQRERAREAWLARFGRSVAGHVAEVVAGRLTTERGSTAQWTLGNLLSLDDRQVLPGSSFVLPLSAEGAPGWTAWGRGAYSEFDGEEDGLELDGEVRSGTLGVDLERGAWRWGLALSHSKGDGDTAEAKGERLALESTLTSAHPYARWQATEALSAWGMLGFGVGELEEERDGKRTQTDLDMRMAAFGLRGALGARRDFGLAVKSDLLLVRVETDAEAGLSGEADTGRLRVLLEGAGRYPLESGGLLSPMLEAGLRYDEGDAETGLGAELGAGLRYADGSGQLSLALTTRALVAHEESEYEEWGVGGSLRLDGLHGRGLSLSLESALGATGHETDELWTRRDLAGLARDDFVAAGRLKAEMGLGLNAVGGRGTFTPYARYEHMEGRRAWRLGGRLQAGEIIRLDFGGMQREARDNGAEHELTVELSGRW